MSSLSRFLGPGYAAGTFLVLVRLHSFSRVTAQLLLVASVVAAALYMVLVGGFHKNSTTPDIITPTFP